MAAVVKCDACGAIVGYSKAKHVRVFTLDSATTYRSPAEHHADICSECHKKLKTFLNIGGNK